jgi:hypothetical protein
MSPYADSTPHGIVVDDFALAAERLELQFVTVATQLDMEELGVRGGACDVDYTSLCPLVGSV